MLCGLDVGGTKIAFAVYDQALNCLFEEQTPTPHDYTSFISTITDMALKADVKFNVKGLVGLGFTGAINPEDMSLNCANVPAIKDLSVSLRVILNLKMMLIVFYCLSVLLAVPMDVQLY